ncbi:hypothetical protein FLAV_00926 [Flavobacteriales bacterium]|nr:hypothetical protein FLAV_00926 [Flavobacteriales bacterium]
MKKLTLYIFLFWVATTQLSAQKNEADKNLIIEKRIEFLLENSEDTEEDYSTLFDRFLYFFDNPINLNNTNKQELQDLSLLNEIQINYLLEHIRLHGKLMALEELQSIEGFTLETILLIKPFVKISYITEQARLSWNELIKNGKHSYFIRYQQILEKQAGYAPIEDSLLALKPNSRYLGSNARLFTRYRYTYGNTLSLGITTEKDPGEEFFRGTQKNGFDFYSAHFFIRNRGKMKQLAIGDYQAQFGQGLTLWSGLAFGKGADILLIKRNATGLLPYSSVDENRFLRGAGSSWQFNNIELTAFYSSKKIDANVQEPDTSFAVDQDVTTITSFQQSGFHRTPGEIADKNSVQRIDAGGHFAYKRRNLNVGTTIIHSAFNSNYKPNLSYYNQFNLDTNYLTNLGVDYNYVYRNINLFGETSHSLNAGFASINGAIMMLDPKLTFSILHRNFQRNYRTLLSNAIAENTLPYNEQGLYLGIKSNPLKYFSITAYFDTYKFTWLKYQVNSPSEGNEYLVQLNYTPSKKLDMYVRVRERSKFRNTQTPENTILYPVEQNQINYRYDISYKVTDAVKLKSRIELLQYKLGENEKNEKGFMLYQDVIYQSLKSPFTFTFRYTLFETDSYDSRIYAYENDVLYAFSIPAYYYRGSRSYLIIKYSGIRNVDFWFRIAQTFYNNQTEIGSGLDLINGNTKTEIKAQIRISF